MQIKPLNDWAVIVPSEAAERTAGGLYIPDAAKEKPAEGVVEAIGPGALEEESWKDKKEKGKKKERKFVPTTVKPGERVLYERYAGTKIEVGGVERVLVRERSILGIFAGGIEAAPRTLMLPERTSAGETSLARAAMSAITAHAPSRPLAASPIAQKAAPKKKTVKKSAKKAVKKAVKKAAKKKVKKAVKKAAGKTAAKPKKAAPKRPSTAKPVKKKQAKKKR